MANEILENIDNNIPVDHVKSSLIIDVIHKFSQEIISAKTEDEIFKILADEVAKQMNFVDCVIYKVENNKKILKQVAAFGPSKVSTLNLINPLELKFGQGHAGMVAQTGETLLVGDVTKSKDYILDIIQAGSELIVPVKIDDVVYAVITTEHPKKYFYKENHQKLLEVITSITVGALVKIQEASERGIVKQKLEVVLERKSADLDMAIETLSTQYSKLKHQHAKQESLIQEVHHRVTNNLQIISSILRLYMNQPNDKLNDQSLQEVHNRVQAMALIYQNIYKSIEVSLVNIDSYLYDLINYLKSSSTDKKVFVEIDVELDDVGIDVLIPLGLYITEIYYYWLGQLGNKKEINLRMKLDEAKGDFSYSFLIEDDEAIPFMDEVDLVDADDVSSTLISALIDQLDGEFTEGFHEGNFMKLRFKA